MGIRIKSKVAVVSLVLALGCDTQGSDSDPLDDGAGGGKQDATGQEFPTHGSLHVMNGDLPTLFRVVDVKPDDVLNVRSAPDAKAPIIDTLSSDAAQIEIVGSDFAGEWGIVNVEDGGSGWVSLRFLESHDEVWPTQGMPEHLSCFGSEPFWKLSVDSGALLLSRPGEDMRLDVEQVLLPGGFAPAMPSRMLSAKDEDSRATVAVTPGLCSDGASDTTYGLYASVLVDNKDGSHMLSGCCSIEPHER